MKLNRRIIYGTLFFLGALLVMTGYGIWYFTAAGIRDVPVSLSELTGRNGKPQLTDRYGTPVTVTYLNQWNNSSTIPLHEIPDILKQIFIQSEDKRFYDHGGVDWLARMHAVLQNTGALSTVRGASTITEQVVRMIHPRPRTLWSRWIEGFEASALETNNSKDDILEFYLNQVPYASNRRGIVQACDYYFNRSPDTLSLREMVTLAVLVRAPSAYDLYRKPDAAERSINRLAALLAENGVISVESVNQIKEETFQLESPGLDIDAAHFAGYIHSHSDETVVDRYRRIRTTLDGPLQVSVSKILRKTLADNLGKQVVNGACIVTDHTTGEILSWVSAGIGNPEESGASINAVLVPRQPGSSLKPFLYALALEKGWTAATLIEDTPLTNPVGRGLHTYHNYSRIHYGKVTLRNALGNSLNIPAVKAIRFTGVDDYLDRLRLAGINNLVRHPEFYGDGLALGNGEVSLYELVQAYNVLANRGVYLPLIHIAGMDNGSERYRVFSEEVTSIITSILADPEARGLEFGTASLLNFPVQTAVKTGTSSDYRDSWAAGYDSRYCVGVWFGNLDGRETNGITGSTGPALVLRSVFAELNKRGGTKPLYMSPDLERQDICLNINGSDTGCVIKTEWFIRGTVPESVTEQQQANRIGFLKPVNGLEMAMDPRIPDENEAFEFVVDGVSNNDQVFWRINGRDLGVTQGGHYVWPLQKGRHVVEATVLNKKNETSYHGMVTFHVK